MRTLAKDLGKSVGKKVHLEGWLNNIRSIGKLNFLILRDRSGLAQIVIEDKEEIKAISHCYPGTVLKIEGLVVQNEQKVEVVQPSIEVISKVVEPPAIEYYKPEIPSDLEFILDHRPIALRNRKIHAVFKIQAEIAHAYRLYMHDQVDATEYFGPNLIGASSEGGAEFFNVDYFGYTATLAQSSQLYKQVMVGVSERAFAIMPFFRAEPSHTTRHLSEGKQLEFEMGFFNHWHDILDVEEGCIKSIVKHLKKECAEEIEILGGIIDAPEEIAFPRLTFKEAQELYFKRTGVDERSEPDLSPAAERELCAWAKEALGTDLVFVTDWKTEKRPFYSYPKPEDPSLTNTFDLLCAGTEITSGGQRRHTYDSMVEGILMKGMDPQGFEDYLSIFKYGMPPHGGFGIGLERLTMTILKLKNIREVSLFPSDTKRIAGIKLKAKIFFGEENVRNEILRQLRAQGMQHEHILHGSASTSQEAADIRGTKVNTGIKALILKGKQTKKNYQFCIPAHLKMDMKAVSELVGEKCEFESPEVIKERFGLTIGGIPPWGNLLNLEVFFDDQIQAMQDVVFSCGLLTESIEMKGKDLVQLVQPRFGSFTKES